jgi:Glycosyltransferase
MSSLPPASESPADTPRPRILHCVSHLALGGAERVALTLIGALRNDFDFGVCAIRGIGDGDTGRALAAELRAAGVPLIAGPRIPMRFGGMLTGAVTIARATRAFRPDAIHLHTEIPEASYAALLAARPHFSNTPAIRTIHNAVFWAFWPALGRWVDRRLAAAFCAGVSAGSADAAMQLRARSGCRPFPEPPVVIYNGVPTPRTRRAPEPTRPTTAPLRLVFGGRLEDQKGADLLPAIVRQTRLPAGRRVHLSIFGSGRHARLLQALTQTPPPGWSIELHPPSPDFRQKLPDFDLLLMPSRFEGLPLVAIEAALAELPIVATTAPGSVEALPPDYPWLARVGDAADFAAKLTDALASRAQRQTLAAQNRVFAEQRFALDLMADAYRRLYRRVLPGQPHTVLAASKS